MEVSKDIEKGRQACKKERKGRGRKGGKEGKDRKGRYGDERKRKKKKGPDLGKNVVQCLVSYKMK